MSQIRKILRTAGQHNIALLGAGHLGKAIASSDIFADHGFRVVAIFDVDPAKVATRVGSQTVRHTDELRQIVEEEDTPSDDEALRRVQEMLGATPLEGGGD